MDVFSPWTYFPSGRFYRGRYFPNPYSSPNLPTTDTHSSSLYRISFELKWRTWHTKSSKQLQLTIEGFHARSR